MAKSGGSQNVKQETTVKLPKWVEQASQENYQFAQDIAAKPYEAYQGKTVADISPYTQMGADFLTANVGASSQALGGAQSGLLRLLHDTQGGDPIDLSRWMNPFTDEVETKALGALEDQRQQGIMRNADAAIAAKAFGGSRHGITEAVTNSESAKAAGLLSAQLRSDNFKQAMAGRQSDQQTSLATVSGLLDTAGAIDRSKLQDFTSLLSMGDVDRGYNQQVLDADRAKFEDEKNYDLERLNVLLSSLGMSPYGKTESQVKTGSSSSSPDMAVAGLGVLKLLSSLPFASDKRLKTDIEKLGKDPETGLDMYAYRYKSDPKTYPKVVGPMAQDIEKEYPEAVRKVGGKRVVGVGAFSA